MTSLFQNYLSELSDRSRQHKKMKSVVIEFEYLFGKYNSLAGVSDVVIKELAVTTVEERPATASWIFAPPYNEAALTAANQRQNLWVTRNLHGLNWNSGLIPYHKLDVCLDLALQNADRLFSKGTEKVTYLSNRLRRTVHDLNDYNCPRASELEDEDLLITCLYPHPTTRTRKACAFEKSLIYADWAYNNEADINVSFNY